MFVIWYQFVLVPKQYVSIVILLSYKTQRLACSIIEIAWLHQNNILKIVIAYRLFEVGAIQLFLKLTGGNSILIPSFYDVPPSRYFNCVQENVYLHLLIAI